MCALKANKVPAISLSSAGQLSRPWIEQAVSIQQIGQQAISNGSGALTQKCMCGRCEQSTRTLRQPQRCAQRGNGNQMAQSLVSPHVMYEGKNFSFALWSTRSVKRHKQTLCR